MQQSIPEDLPPNVVPFKRPVDRPAELTKRIQTRLNGQLLEFELTEDFLTLSTFSSTGEWMIAPYSYISLSRVELNALRHWLLSSEVTQFLEKE